MLAGPGTPAEQARTLAATAGIVVVKLGAAGAVWHGPDGVASVRGTPAESVDTTGAGDAFAAGLLAAWLAGAGPEAALAAGGATGGIAVAQFGARPQRATTR